MVIKSHLCGLAVAYEPMRMRTTEEPSKSTGRPQGSLYGQQKKKIADASEWIRCNSVFKPLVFVATSPGFVHHAEESSLISKLTHNLRNGYGCQNYVWVREFTGAGYPHFHFIADVDRVDPVKLSLYWSGLFGSDAKNSIRLGFGHKSGTVKYHVNSAKQCWYLTKYLGKSVGNEEKGALKGKKSFRTFGISQEAAKKSEPLIYGEDIQQMFNGLHQRNFVLHNDLIEEGLPQSFNPHSKRWHWTGHGQTYIGTPKSWTKKPQKVTP